MNNNTTNLKEELLLDNECIICFENIDKKFSYVECNNCNKMYHEYCISKWKYKRRMINTSCPTCSTNNLYLHNFYVNYCCFPFKVKKNNLKEKITKFH